MSGALEPLLIAARLVQFASAMILLGAPLFRLSLGRAFDDAAMARAYFDRRLRLMLIAAAALALLSAALWLDLEAAIMGGDWREALDSETVATVLQQTVFGHAWRWHMAIATALLGFVLLVRGDSKIRAWYFVVAALAAALIVSMAWAGHAVMRPGVSHVAIQAVHLLAGGVWLGSLPALFLLAERGRRDPNGAWVAALRHVLPRYSRAGYLAVGLVLLTGCLNSWFLVGSPGALVTTEFGRVLLVKVALVLVMVALALANRFAVAPRFPATLPALWRNVAWELGVGLLVLAAVSVLGTLPPGMAP